MNPSVPQWQQQPQHYGSTYGDDSNDRESQQRRSYGDQSKGGFRGNSSGLAALSENAPPLRHLAFSPAPDRDVGSSSSRASGNRVIKSGSDDVVTESQSQPSDDVYRETWDTLDISNVGVRSIAVEICNFRHLTQLYLNNNNLTAIPPQLFIGLSNLRHVDLSCNQLAFIPPQVGEALDLEELLLYNNHLQTLPVEMGRLFRLKTLGIDGNPIHDPPTKILQQGALSIVHYLRDNMPVPDPPPPRRWLSVSPSRQNAHTVPIDAAPAGSITVVCFNVLAEPYATPEMYPYCPSWALSWDYRKKQTMAQLLHRDADIICLQEVTLKEYRTFFLPELESAGYSGVFKPKSRAMNMNDSERLGVDGCATFFKTSKLSLVDEHHIDFSHIATARDDLRQDLEALSRLMTRDNIALAVRLKVLPNSGIKVNPRSGVDSLFVVNTHIHWDPRNPDIKLVQSQIMLEEIMSLSHRDAVVVCGDFNSTPDSAVYQLFETGEVLPDNAELAHYKYGTYATTGLRHRFHFASSYERMEEPVTNYTGDFKGTLDYSWYSLSHLRLTALLEPVPVECLRQMVGLPNAHYPSDHLLLCSALELL